MQPYQKLRQHGFRCRAITCARLSLQVTHDVALLARWMAADLFLREVEVLRFEVLTRPLCLGFCLQNTLLSCTQHSARQAEFKLQWFHCRPTPEACLFVFIDTSGPWR